MASGDTTLLNQKQAKREAAEKLRMGNNVNVEAGYAYLFEKAPAALYFSVDYMRFMGAKVYYAGSDFWTFGGFIGVNGSFTAGNFGIMPYGRFGFDYQHDKGYDDATSGEFAAGFPIAVMVQGGLKITSTYVPGLFAGVGFQYNLFNMNEYEKAMQRALSITAGYAF